MTYHNKIREFVQTMLWERSDRLPFGDVDTLFTSGRLDSMAAVNLVMFLEQEFSIDFADIGLDLERIDSVIAIAELVQEHGGISAY